MKLIIKRKRWGVGNEGGKLLNSENNKMCCLGFFCKQAGFKANEIIDQGMPIDVFNEECKRKRDKRIKIFLNEDKSDSNEITEKLVDINDSDSPWYTPKRRENAIKRLFRKLDVNVEFVD